MTLRKSTTILKSDDYSLRAGLVTTVSPVGGFALTITSRRLASRHPEEEQVRFFSCLDREGLQSLARLIQDALTAQDERTKP